MLQASPQRLAYATGKTAVGSSCWPICDRPPLCSASVRITSTTKKLLPSLSQQQIDQLTSSRHGPSIESMSSPAPRHPGAIASAAVRRLAR